MRTFTWAVFIVLLIPAVAPAAYINQAEVLRYEQDQDGAARLIMRFTGDAGEPIVDKPYNVTGAFSRALLRNWVDSVVDELNKKRSAGMDQQVGSGTRINGLAATPPAPSAKAVWRTKASTYREICGSGFVGTVATDCAALKTDIENTYSAGYLND